MTATMLLHLCRTCSSSRSFLAKAIPPAKRKSFSPTNYQTARCRTPG
ncbi:unnamed protein product [Soboliphyme baturini]|uniref:Secreted protein n=1 Tax=Soboliphyme baturini TaxID=241478 RepID=A0A183J8V6_9BILA|nr:unnamed protein product [Soboliphyme baturini]